MINKIKFLFFLAAFFSLAVSAQPIPGLSKFKISGTLKDSADQKTLEYFTVHLKNSLTQRNVSSQLTKENGTFEFAGLEKGKYILEFVGFGYATLVKDFDIEKDQNLGVVYLSRQNKQLSEVTVVASKPLIKQEIDKLSYDVDADPEGKVLNVLDMMRKVPMLTVDGEDNIKLKGSGSYRILINGKPSSMVANNPKDILKSMSAADIEKIEVITTPPAKYDSEGLSGLINIITKKRVDNGYNGSISLRHRFPAGGPGASTSFTVKQGKFGVSGYAGLNRYKNPKTESYNIRTTKGENPRELSQFMENEYKSLSSYLSTEFSYEIDTLNLISGELGGFGSDGTQTRIQRSVETNPTQSYKLDNSSDNGWGGKNFALNYQRNFKKNKDRILTASYRFDSNKNTQDNAIAITERVDYPLQDYQQANVGKSREQTFQLDYVHPVNKLNIEGGVKGILRRNESDFKLKRFDPNTGGFVIDPAQTNDFVNDQNVYGIYNSYHYRLQKWGFKGGIRLEETIIDADFITTSSVLKKKFFNVIPILAINHSLKNNYNLNFGFTQRIERPGIWQLNPFVDRSNPDFISSGNPELRPVVSNNIDFGVSTYKKGSYNFTLGYSFANNTIQRVSVYDENTGVTTSSFYNIGKDKRLNLNINVSYPITKDLNFSMGSNMGYLWIQGYLDGVLLKNDGIQGFAYGSLGYKFENGLRLNSYMNYQSPWVRLQGKTNDFYYLSFSANKDLIKDKLNFSMAVNNPFQKFRNWNNEFNGDNFIQRSSSQNYFRSFNLNMNYKFGKLKTQAVKKNRRGIKNDDKSSGGGGSEGGSSN